MQRKLYMFDYNGKGVIVNNRKLKGLAASPPPNGYLNILILGDGYPYPCTEDGFPKNYYIEEFYKAREAIIKKLFSTAPFSAFWPFINIFSRVTASNSFGVGVNGPGDTYFGIEAHHWGPNDPNKHDRKVEINQNNLIKVYNYIKDLTFTGFGLNINGEDEWLTPGKKSFGFVGFIGDATHEGGQRHSAIPIPELQNKYLSYFAAVATPDENNYDNFAHIFIHELGHAFGLADEYDEDEEEKIDPSTGACVNPQYLHHPRRPQIGEDGHLILDVTPLPQPNVILRHELLPSAEQLGDDRTKPLDANNMILTNNKWDFLMTRKDIERHTSPNPQYIVHPSWDHPEHNECRYDYEFDSDGNEIRTPFSWLFDPDEIRITEGAMRYRRDIYRPMFTCYMRNETPETHPVYPKEIIESKFCKVCRFHIMKTIMEKEHWSVGRIRE